MQFWPSNPHGFKPAAIKPEVKRSTGRATVFGVTRLLSISLHCRTSLLSYRYQEKQTMISKMFLMQFISLKVKGCYSRFNFHVLVYCQWLRMPWWSIYPIMHHKQIELWGIIPTSGNFRPYQIQTANIHFNPRRTVLKIISNIAKLFDTFEKGKVLFISCQNFLSYFCELSVLKRQSCNNMQVIILACFEGNSS